jgi:hypothetical protein
LLTTAYLVPFIKNKIGDSNYKKLLNFIAIAVRCAEQLYEDSESEEKKNYVMEQVQSFINDKLNIDITYNELNTLVEGIVNEVKYGVVSDVKYGFEVNGIEVTNNGNSTAD